jgi:folylpolyglutamate synthase/dihydropteroate synthase
MDNYLSGNSIPLGFGMALAQNTAALDAFSSLSKEAQQSFIDGAHNVQSKQEMRSYVNSITNQSF